MKRSAFVIVALALQGCGTTPVSTAETTPVPASRVADSSLLVAKAGTVPLVIKRDAGLAGAACNARVYVDGSEVADLATSERITVHLSPGEHMLAARHNCTQALAEAVVRLQSGPPRTFRIGIGFGGEFTLTQTAF